ncbi:TIGR01777 family oxidoreductase [Paenibacillus aurantiacus]|uniref:TIGR01777 family oxidoreductase n=1 Tax=Paenibacillus aurantiacus TaxID=1936118 RepID=A0ABV5KHY7_9BACL
MRIAVTGGTGFVGQALVSALLARGDEVWIISRKTAQDRTGQERLHYATWQQLEQNPALLEGTDCIVNLAGESINQRWSAKAKARILNSRTDAAARIAKLVGALRQKPATVVNASGISIYGTSDTKTFDESSPAHINDFLGSVVEQWEESARTIPAERLVLVRVSLVLGNRGGAFPLMSLPYRLFGGGRVGSGRQWMPWIHIEDMTRVLLFCIDNRDIAGPVNACAPQPVTTDQFGRAIGKAMRRPHWFPVPAFLLRTLLGEMSSLLLQGQRVLPAKLQQGGFDFRYPTIESAMENLVGKSSKPSV